MPHQKEEADPRPQKATEEAAEEAAEGSMGAKSQHICGKTSNFVCRSAPSEPLSRREEKVGRQDFTAWRCSSAAGNKFLSAHHQGNLRTKLLIALQLSLTVHATMHGCSRAVAGSPR
jgi:hypothetical protein